MNYSDEMINKMANILLEKTAQQELKRMIFIATQQDDVMEKIYIWLKHDNKRTISNESAHRYPSQYPITLDEFTFLFNNIYDYAVDNNLYSSEKFVFANIEINFTYKDLQLRFFQMSGQGTFRCIGVALNMEWNEKKAFTYDKYKKDLFTEK